MARSRNIKPGFFTNDVLGELPALTRLLFAGLWVIADREGRIEDRPKKIRAEVLPYDQCDADEMLNALGKSGFIRRYEQDGIKVIQVLTWSLHQNPHVKEAPSKLPAFVESNTRTVQEQCSIQPLPEQAGLIPDSGFLIPDCGGGTREAQSAVASPPPIFSPENRGFIKTERPDLDGEKVWLNFCDHYPPEKCTTANWRKWVRREMRGPVVGVDLATAQANSDPDSKASIESLGLARGMGRWDQLVEPWATYKTRVKTASMGAMQ